jgi:CDP-glycerol glycerophosphotransferase (TagB/SpsB family)
LGSDRGLDEDRIRLAQTAWEGVRRRPDHTLLIKCHPAENPEFYKSFLGRESRVRIASDAELSLPLALSIADVSVAQWSGSACDALIKGKPLILIDDGHGLFTNRRILDSGACLAARDASDLSDILAARAYLSPEVREKAERFVRDFCVAYGAEAARRTAEELRGLWEGAAPAPPIGAAA